MRAIIGPNGAGKTTMMDVVTGKTRPDSGDIYFDGTVDLTRLDEAAIAELGIGRKFQKPTVFESHTVWDNLELALAGGRGPFAALFGSRRHEPQRAHRGDSSAPSASSDQRHVRAAYLSHGQKQWLEIGMLLAQEPKLLLVDEPAAGMTDAETEATAELLQDIAQEKSVIVVEHDMAFVRALGVKVTVLHEGSVLSEGHDRPRLGRSPGDRGLSRPMTTSMVFATPNPPAPSSSGLTGGPRLQHPLTLLTLRRDLVRPRIVRRSSGQAGG